MSKDDGGPAFPVEFTFRNTDGSKREWHYGLSKREWFAAQALKSFGLSLTHVQPEAAVSLAYQVADMMIKEGKK